MNLESCACMYALEGGGGMRERGNETKRERWVWFYIVYIYSKGSSFGNLVVVSRGSCFFVWLALSLSLCFCALGFVMLCLLCCPLYSRLSFAVHINYLTFVVGMWVPFSPTNWVANWDSRKNGKFFSHQLWDVYFLINHMTSCTYLNLHSLF